jgi:hypothetical protein
VRLACHVEAAGGQRDAHRAHDRLGVVRDGGAQAGGLRWLAA